LLAGGCATRRGLKPTPPAAQFRKVLEDSPRFFAKLHQALLSTEDCPPTDVIQRSPGHKWRILHRKWLTHLTGEPVTEIVQTASKFMTSVSISCETITGRMLTKTA
jgi:hypothetical protein